MDLHLCHFDQVLEKFKSVLFMTSRRCPIPFSFIPPPLLDSLSSLFPPSLISPTLYVLNAVHSDTRGTASESSTTSQAICLLLLLLSVNVCPPDAPSLLFPGAIKCKTG